MSTCFSLAQDPRRPPTDMSSLQFYKKAKNSHYPLIILLRRKEKVHFKSILKAKGTFKRKVRTF